ncbi:gamma-glutamyltransferase [Microcoleus sp. B5-D4]|uniref:gamma-glutamyltransferase n=1 Tax=unclassified Microcoleus TaxID=2642155 RepID=UPI002FD733B4
MLPNFLSKVRIYSCYLTVLVLGGCQQQLQPKLQQQRSKQGMAVSAHPLASAAGLAVLQQGGNAVDAAAATALAISVVEPFSAGIGGGGFLLLQRAQTGTVQALDFRERAPKRATRDMYLDKQGKVRQRASLDGHLAAGIPGTVAGLYTVHREYGKLPWAQVVAPAIALAEKGFPVSSRFTTATGRRQDVLKKNPAAREVFTRGGILYQPGEILVQRDLARTLRQIAQNLTQTCYAILKDRRL